MNKLSIFIFCLLAALSMRAENGLPGSWRLHNSWDYYATEVLDTKDRTFYLMKGQYYTTDTRTSGWTENSNQLFVFDKEHQELEQYNMSNYLHGNIIERIAYNSAKGYLLIVYNDYMIDLLYDDDTALAVPGLSTAVLTSSKKVNGITFDPENNLAYLATDFGYVAIDDKNCVIKESGIYDLTLTGIGRVDDRLVASSADGIFTSPISERHNSWQSFSKLPGIDTSVSALVPLQEGKFAYIPKAGGCWLAEIGEDGTASTKSLFSDPVEYFYENRDGFYMHSGWSHSCLKKDGTMSRVAAPVDLRGKLSGSWDMVNFHYTLCRDGIESRKYNSADQSFTATMKQPSVFPRIYKAFNFAYSPVYGMLAGNQSFTRFQQPYWILYPHLISGYKDGSWTNYGPSMNSASPFAAKFQNGYGPVVDPLDENTLWSGSYYGLYRITLPSNKLEFFSFPGGPGAGKEGFYPVFTKIYDGSENKAHIGVPDFDAEGNLWVVENIGGKTAVSDSPLYCWKASDRRAGNTSAFKQVPVSDYTVSPTFGNVCALKHSANRGIVIFYHPMGWGAPIYILNHKGTIDDPADDQLVKLDRFVDQNGNGLPSIYVNKLWEDPQTGQVWVGTSTGLFTFRPTDMIAGKTNVNRFIINRNDGTNQGDYLMAGQDVLDINADGAGRKWIATDENGLVVVAADGSEIIKHFTTENSMLPSNTVYATGFDPESNAVWIGSRYQMATYYSDVTPGEANFDNVVSYPNPVRPDFYGEVTIQGLVDGSLIKIIDQGGHLVKELGRCQGGMITWNLTNVQGERVSTGVYLIAASGEQESSACVGKILVVK